MRIAFDAKRAFTNDTGLGNYSRMLLDALFLGFPEHDYYLFTPKITDMYTPPQSGNVHIQTPSGINRLFSSLWRSSRVKDDLTAKGIDLYHGLSHEIPWGIQNTRVRSVVTMHDLIFERYPEQYKPADVRIYRTKFKNACTHANKVIAISKQTADDLTAYYNVPADKITVCYQSCDEAFMHRVSPQEKAEVAAKYVLPAEYFLYVGSVIERKNLLRLCEAMKIFKDKCDIPLVVIGKGGAYLAKVKEYVRTNGLTKRVIFLSEHAGRVAFADFPAIYQNALALVYPSIFEGFGIPVLEGLFSQVPVITSNISCMPETGGDAAFYINPFDAEDMANGMLRVATDSMLRQSMVEKGIRHAQNFTPQKAAADVMSVYEAAMQ